jgi:hypothetical protein
MRSYHANSSSNGFQRQSLVASLNSRHGFAVPAFLMQAGCEFAKTLRAGWSRITQLWHGPTATCVVTTHVTGGAIGVEKRRRPGRRDCMRRLAAS